MDHQLVTFNSSQGLKRGDPFSFYLFILGMEILSRILHRKQEKSLQSIQK